VPGEIPAYHNEKETSGMNDEIKKVNESLNEEFEIIELDDRLDMTVDPLTGMLGSNAVPAPNTNCGNIFCC
jgi:hypothetical protein